MIEVAHAGHVPCVKALLAIGALPAVTEEEELDFPKVSNDEVVSKLSVALRGAAVEAGGAVAGFLHIYNSE